MDPLIVFTDGGCTRNGHDNAKACAATIWPEEDYPNGVFFLEPTSVRTNNRAEFLAGIKAMEQANEIDESNTRVLHIFTDSMFLINTASTWMYAWKRNGWVKRDKEPVKNLDLVKQIYDLVSEKKREIVWTHVKSHTDLQDYNSKWNDEVDKLASENVKYDIITKLPVVINDKDLEISSLKAEIARLKSIIGETKDEVKCNLDLGRVAKTVDSKKRKKDFWNVLTEKK